MRSVAGGIDGIGAVFDDGSLVADGGLLLAGTVMSRLGLEALIDDTVRPGGSAGAGAGAKVLTLVVLVGGCCIDDARRLGSGSAAGVLPFAPLAPSTLGTFLRSFTFACAPARQGRGDGACAGVVCGRRAERGGDDGGFGLHGV